MRVQACKEQAHCCVQINFLARFCAASLNTEARQLHIADCRNLDEAVHGGQGQAHGAELPHAREARAARAARDTEKTLWASGKSPIHVFRDLCAQRDRSLGLAVHPVSREFWQQVKDEWAKLEADHPLRLRCIAESDESRAKAAES